ncbi:BlaI/MecI/CopY family transcriptional regulator [Neolewinella lacunae]|uniref:BlaI/MecI/CopY family transcriptional regulator n=1 Tax=Neolewinella lacunae TaxID=1517758 RepID=A0A923PPI9_9BACT|nr:BlaI/MecI/CopY family transcriptional regulator [Neolewinella lacunae]MBC6995431.1 BlaI/MecI/CopY family transcriptional regulator [Neolewinella lacunae]MDN3633150.1 BlaI/MecI/CopY family transcriptional regulator [Neolewinella lacunae]
MPDLPMPSEAQLEILDLLWQQQPATVQDLHERLADRRQVSYNTVLTQLQRMAKAGFVLRNTEQRTHTYVAALRREQVEHRLFDRLADTAFGGSKINLALRALGNETPTAQELDELQEWINRQKK